ncbi:hypothetical protein HK101_007253, partial [Irineochytrium annulatum]
MPSWEAAAVSQLIDAMTAPPMAAPVQAPTQQPQPFNPYGAFHGAFQQPTSYELMPPPPAPPPPYTTTTTEMLMSAYQPAPETAMDLLLDNLLIPSSKSAFSVRHPSTALPFANTNPIITTTPPQSFLDLPTTGMLPTELGIGDGGFLGFAGSPSFAPMQMGFRNSPLRGQQLIPGMFPQLQQQFIRPDVFSDLAHVGMPVPTTQQPIFTPISPPNESPLVPSYAPANSLLGTASTASPRPMDQAEFDAMMSSLGP